MAQFPAFPLWTDAYLADTGHLTTIEHGAYLLLLMTMWRAGGSLPKDDKQLARYARMSTAQWVRIKPTMMPFFRVSADSITQGRLTDELVAVRQKSERQSNSARAKWRKNRDMRHADADAESPVRDMPDASHIDASQTLNLKEEDKSSSYSRKTSSRKSTVSDLIEAEFLETFWPAYPRKVDRKDALRAFRKARKRVDLATIMTGLEAYARDSLKSEPQFIRHAATWLNADSWENYQPQAAAPAAVSGDKWRARLEGSRKRHNWSTREWGPAPGRPGCLAPPEMLQPGDGDGWTEIEVAA